MSIPQNIKGELAKRDELILALEMLVVDQSCRLLALEAVVVNMAGAGNVKAGDIKARIAKESKRYQQHFEGESMIGFVERAHRIAKQLSNSAKVAGAAKVVNKNPPKRAK